MPRATYDGRALEIATRPLCAVLLAMLVLASGRRLSRKAIAADLWPDDDEATSAANLRRHLSALIAALPAERAWIDRDREAVWWSADAPYACDVTLFERGEADRYAADFMLGHAHEWVLGQRERLRYRAVEELVARAAERQENDDYAGALACARRAVELDPQNESAAQLEIELLGERGDIAGMNVAAAALEGRLREIDTSPGATTLELVERFRAAGASAGMRLPRPVTSFVGGDASVGEIVAAINSHRLTTVVGTGGVGKTRTAIEAAHRVAVGYSDGAYFVDLSAVGEGDAIVDALLRALGVPREIAGKGLAGACAFLRNRRALIVMDNCEQVVDSCAWLIGELLQAAPRIGILATSREALGLASERVLRLQPLAPEDAVALFVERARKVADVGPDETRDNARLERVCEQLDRLPLAIELAAGLRGNLTLEQIEANLGDRFGLLHSRDRTVPHRHRTLERVIEWSFARLTPAEREALAKLAIFNGSFDPAAASAICGVDLTAILGLLEKSVLTRDGPDSGRYRSMISIAAFARRLLAERDDEARLRDAHATYFEQILAEPLGTPFWQRDARWLALVERDFSNVTAALHWTLQRDGRPETGVGLVLAVWPYFDRRGYYADGRVWTNAALVRAGARTFGRGMLLFARAQIDFRRSAGESALEGMLESAAVLAECGAPAEAARGLASAAGAALLLRRDDEAVRLLGLAQAAADAGGDLRSQASVMTNRGYLLGRSGDRPAGRKLYAQALPLYEAVGDVISIARTLNNLATLDFISGRYDAAESALARALQMSRENRDLFSCAGQLSDLGDVALLQGDDHGARLYYAEALDIAESLDILTTFDRTLAGFAALAAATGKAGVAARLLGASQRGREKAGDPQADAIVRERARTGALDGLTEEEFAAQMLAGSTLDRVSAAGLARTVELR